MEIDRILIKTGSFLYGTTVYISYPILSVHCRINLFLRWNLIIEP